MTKSRTALRPCAALIPFIAATSASAQPVDPQALIEAQRRELRTSLNPGCPANINPDEIVVCGTRNDERHRVPPQEVPGAIANGDRAAGAQRAALGADDQRCTAVGRAQQCNGGLNMIAIGETLVRAIDAIADPD